MNLENQQTAPSAEPVKYSVPWNPIDNWIGVALLVLVDVGILSLSLLGQKGQLAQSWTLILVQLVYLLPVIIVFAWRQIPWRSLGFGIFDWGTMAIGCGLFIISYGIIFAHNLILTLLGIDTQGDEIMKLLRQIDSPIWFLLVGALLAPPVEEIFFRGFLFQGFRARYGWVNSMLLSSVIFAIAHLDLASLIPTFVLGNLLAYLYHRSNSIWPGVILHSLVNTSSLLFVYFLSQNPQLIPS